MRKNSLYEKTCHRGFSFTIISEGHCMGFTILYSWSRRSLETYLTLYDYYFFINLQFQRPGRSQEILFASLFNTSRDPCSYVCMYRDNETFPDNYLYSVNRHITINLMSFLCWSCFFSCHSRKYILIVADFTMINRTKIFNRGLFYFILF